MRKIEENKENEEKITNFPNPLTHHKGYAKILIVERERDKKLRNAKRNGDVV